MKMPLLQSMFAAQVERRPDAVALVMGDVRMTYGELERRSNQLANLLHESGLRRGNRVGVLMNKSPDAICSFLGVLKADCIYVPMDPSSPAARLQKIVESCESKWILASEAASSALDQLLVLPELQGKLSVGSVGRKDVAGKNFSAAIRRDDIISHDDKSRSFSNSPDDAAHILFTSGSTGVPKGVVITHANVAHFVQWGIKYFDIGPEDRNSGHSPLQFDLSTFDIYGTLSAGAQLFLVAPELNLVPGRIADFIRATELTQWFSAPAILNHMAKFDVVAKDDFPRLKRLLWCGEVFPTPGLIYWMKQLPHVIFTNLYGPTEATIASSYYTVPQCPADEKAAIPIGQPCEGESLFVLDDDLRPVPAGQTGWLYIGGVGLSPGYWRDPEKTNSVFVVSPHLPDPKTRIYKTGDLARIGDDGLVYYLGRADSQIKCRGYRIELGEIETALNVIPGLRECAVVAIETGGLEGKAICCAFVPSDEETVTPVFLRKEAGKALPAYMLPSRWMRFEMLPKNSNGKIDRRRLREEFEASNAKPTPNIPQAV